MFRKFSTQQHPLSASQRAPKALRPLTTPPNAPYPYYAAATRRSTWFAKHQTMGRLTAGPFPHAACLPHPAPPSPPLTKRAPSIDPTYCRDRNTYKWREGAGGTDQLVSHIHGNLWTANYFASVPIDHECVCGDATRKELFARALSTPSLYPPPPSLSTSDGSNGYIDTNNVLLWGGTKSLMGYNKHHVNEMMVYVDLNPALHAPAARRIGWSAPESKPPMCSGFIVPTPSAPGKFEVWAVSLLSRAPPSRLAPRAPQRSSPSEPHPQRHTQNNTCISTDPTKFFRWYSCASK